ncbi:MAG: trigger factor, partial [Pseudoflavonifractor sp.]
RETQAKSAFESALLEQVVTNMECEIPDAMVDNRADQMMEDYARRITAQGIPFEQYLQMMGMTKETMKEQAKEGALRQVQIDLALAAVAAAEKIEITEEDKEAEFKRLAEQYNMPLEQVKAAVPADDMELDLKNQKASELIFSTAKIGAAPEKKVAPKKETVEAAVEEKPKKAPAKKAAPKKDADVPSGEEKPKKAPAKKSAPKKTAE